MDINTQVKIDTKIQLISAEIKQLYDQLDILRDKRDELRRLALKEMSRD